MTITILYFASLREALGREHETLALPGGVGCVGALREALHARGGAWEALAAGKAVRAAVNQALAHAETPLADGDEVAFFPPVTGG